MKNKPKTNKAYKPTQNESPIKSFVRKKGFYIALFSLVAILTGSVFVSSYMNKSKEIGSSFDDEAWKAAIAESERNSVIISDSADEKIPETEPSYEKAAASDTQTENEASAEEDYDSTESISSTNTQTENISADAVTLADIESIPDEEVQAVSAQTADNRLRFTMPCIGGITKEFSMDELLYSETMDDWRTHSGIDISADEGAQVKAAADGTVEKVYTDDMLGNVIIIDHGNGMKTLYGNLQSADYIKSNHAVKQGDIIGGVGTSSGEEKADGAHLHFEVLKDGEPIKPEFLD